MTEKDRQGCIPIREASDCRQSDITVSLPSTIEKEIERRYAETKKKLEALSQSPSEDNTPVRKLYGENDERQG